LLGATLCCNKMICHTGGLEQDNSTTEDTGDTEGSVNGGLELLGWLVENSHPTVVTEARSFQAEV
jgi:hypothetical protein